MSTSNLKPSKDLLESNLDQYRAGAESRLSNLEFEVLQAICKTADKAMRVVACAALAPAPEHLKVNLFPSLTAGTSALPMATQVGNAEAYRIAIPISFVDKLLEVTPTRGGRPPKEAPDYFISSTIVAVLAAYGHEMIHVFAGHLQTPSSRGQETHADFIGGSLLWAWLQDEDIATLCQIQIDESPWMCAYGFLHLISVLSDSNHDDSLYLPRCLRLAAFAGGAGFCADKTVGPALGDLVQQAFQTMPICPKSEFESSAIRSQHATLTEQLRQPQLITKMQLAFQEMNHQKSSWYKSSEHLRPIKKDIGRALKRDSSSSGKN